ncbi:hypothetical protein [Streptomyces sp. NPDC048172]|uniref:hypothetical protein n=1 Tax=Streptomyces sp. NPDC048172 TaxID=3365505 RepID=UPI0037124638
MTGASHFSTPFVNDPSGPVHAGPGDMYVTVLQQAGIDASRTGPDPRRVTEEQLTWWARRFSPPGRLADARDTLHARGVALLTGDPGSGRRCAALMLLHELREPYGSRGRFHELLDQGEEEEGGKALDPGHVGDHDRLLLDLVHLGEERRQAVLKELDDFVGTVRERHAHLAVVLPAAGSSALPPEHLALAVRIGRPDGREVLLRYLHQEAIRPEETDLGHSGLTEFLERESMERISSLAVHIREARQRDGEGLGFADWLATALRAVSPSDTEVAKWLTETGHGTRRALLLTTGFLHGARSDTVHRATHALVNMARHPAVATPLLAHEPLAARLDSVHAELREGRVFLKELGRDRIVRTHGWNNFPDVRPALRGWVRRIATESWLDHDERAALVRRFTLQWLRTEPPDELKELPEKWAAHPQELLGRAAASQLLRHAVLHERHGARFRRMLYFWAKEASLGVGLAHVLIGVCTEYLLARYPDQAMIRLRHLARHPHASVREAARVALTRVTRGDDRLYRRLIVRLRPEYERHSAADSELFLHLTEPSRLLTYAPRAEPLLAEPALRILLATHWFAVRRRVPVAAWSARELSWLDAARAEGPHGELLLDVLVDSCASDATAASRLYVAARDWAAGSPAVHQDAAATVLARVQARIRTALGIGRRPSPFRPSS